MGEQGGSRGTDPPRSAVQIQDAFTRVAATRSARFNDVSGIPFQWTLNLSPFLISRHNSQAFLSSLCNDELLFSCVNQLGF